LLKDIFDFSEKKYVQLIEQSYNPDCFKEIFPFIKECASKVSHVENLAWAKIRDLLSHHRSCIGADWALSEFELNQYEELYYSLEPINEIDKVIWIFDDNYQQFLDGVNLDEISFEEREKIIRNKKEAVIETIYSAGGIDEVIKCAGKVIEKYSFGEALASVVNSEEEIIQLCHLLNEEDSNSQFIHAFIRSKVRYNGIDWGITFFGKLEKLEFDNYALVNFLLPLPQSRIILDLIDSKNKDIINGYWQKINPSIHSMHVELKVLILNKLISHKRYITALKLACTYSEELSNDTLLGVLENAGTNNSDEDFTLRPYDLRKIFKVLYERDGISDDIYAKLEWLYISILTSNSSGQKPKVLHNELAKNPELFIEILRCAYIPRNEELLTQENKDISDIVARNRGVNAFKLLKSWKAIPGLLENGDVDKNVLDSWVHKVRELAINIDRLDSADSNIGKILAQYPETTTVWPPDEICELIETLNSEVINKNYSVTLLNKRGSTSRGAFDGGNIERDYAACFHRLASYHINTFPSVSAIFDKIAIRYDHMAIKADQEAEVSRLDY
jgi:hypothetical protein